MRNYQESDYALNKCSPNIVYRFSDGIVEVTMEDFLQSDPSKTEQDFANLKEKSDKIFYIQDRKDTRYGKRKSTIGANEETMRFATPALEEYIIEDADRRNALAAAKQLLDSGKLTDVQKRRFLLHICEGLSIRQIATLDKVGYRAVWDSLHWATQKLKKNFFRQPSE